MLFSLCGFLFCFIYGFLADDGGCDGGWDGDCTAVAGSVGSSVVAAAFDVVVVSVVAFAAASFAGSVVLWVGFFPLSCHLDPPFFRFVWVVPKFQGSIEKMVSPGYCCWCCYCWWCYCSWWLTSVDRLLINDQAVCRTSRVASFPPWPPSSAGPYRSVCVGWPGIPPY